MAGDFPLPNLPDEVLAVLKPLWPDHNGGGMAQSKTDVEDTVRDLTEAQQDVGHAMDRILRGFPEGKTHDAVQQRKDQLMGKGEFSLAQQIANLRNISDFMDQGKQNNDKLGSDLTAAGADAASKLVTLSGDMSSRFNQARQNASVLNSLKSTGDGYAQTTKSNNDGLYQPAEVGSFDETGGFGLNSDVLGSNSAGQSGSRAATQAITSQTAQTQAGAGQQSPSTRGAAPGGASQGAVRGAGATPAGGASTGLQSGAAVQDRPQIGAAPSASQAVPQAAGGAGAAPSISGVGGAPASGGGGQAPRIGGVGAGAGGGEGPRTTAQGAGVGEKPVASQSSSGSSQQGSGLSRGGGAGAGAVGGETRAQSASAAGVREAMRGDAAAGAGAYADKAAASAQVLATGSLTGLAGPSLNALTTRTQAAASSRDALPDRLSARSPALDSETAGALVLGGRISGAGRWGFGGGGGVEFKRWPVDPVDAYGGVSYLILVSEDHSVAPNPDAGVFRPVRSEVTSTEPHGMIRAAFDVPDGVLVMDRSEVPDKSPQEAGVWSEANPGRLAVALARWRIGLFGANATSWRPVAVGFVSEPEAAYVGELAQLGLEAYWPGRVGFGLDGEAEAALASGTGRVAEASTAAEREERARFDGKSAKWGVPAGVRTDVPYDGRGLEGKDKASYDDYKRELGRSPTGQEYVEDRMLRKRHSNGAVDESINWD